MMRVIFTGILVAMLFVTSFAEAKISEREKREISGLLDKQVQAWNEGNLEKFMQTYWKSKNSISPAKWAI
jgi:hypothetical protein